MSGLDRVAHTKLHRRLPFVVYYHRVVEQLDVTNGVALPAMEISTAMLEQHLDWLGRHFRIVSMEDLDMHLMANSKRPPAIVTFDDGYSDIYHHAFPLLKRKGIPAGIFVITDLVGSSSLPLHEELHALLVRAAGRIPLDSILEAYGLAGLEGQHDPFSATRLLIKHLPHESLQRIIDAIGGAVQIDGKVRDLLRPLSWEMLEEMRDAGMTIGSHTKSHPLLTNETSERVLQEVHDSRLELQKRLAIKADCFAYPGGGFDTDVVKAVAASGYKYGFSICRHADPQYPLLTIPRRGMWERSCLDAFGRFSPDIMSCQAAGAFDWLSGCTEAHAA
jgi:peptidoglycan/xylan/chitin deacetylase (PgdA/CDA1 family)